MKKLVLTASLVFFLIFPSSVFAQEAPPPLKELLLDAVWEGEKRQFWDWGEKEPKVLGVSEEELLPSPKGPLPGHPFYFLKRLRENLGLVFTFDPIKKEEKRLEIAQERLAEANKLLGEKPELSQKLLTVYSDQVSQVAETLEAVPKEERKRLLAEKLEVIAARHEAVLEKVLEKVPKEAKPAIEKAIEVSQRGMDKAADALGKPPLPPDFKSRLEALKRQALLTPQEIANIIASSSREEAREKIKHLLEEGKIPEADFKLLDEAQKQIAPTEFERIRERKKVEELRKLEAQEPSEEIKKEVEKFVKNYQVGDPIPPKIAPYLPLQRIEELRETIRPEVLIGEEIKKGDFVGPGGCFNEQTCHAYCSQPAHRKECLEFLKTAPEWLKKKAKLPEKLGEKQRTGPGGCKSRRECEQFCSDPKNRSECEKFAPLFGRKIEERKGPESSPPCRSEEECKVFCQDPAHRGECERIWQKYAPSYVSSERKEEVKPERPKEEPIEERKGPGGCRTPEECQRYCQENPQDPACGRKPEEAPSLEGPPPLKEMPPGISPPKEFPTERVKGWFSAGNKGPGGCNGILSCFFYCKSPRNWSECQTF